MINTDLLNQLAPTVMAAHENNKRALAALDGVLLGDGHVILVGDLAIKPMMQRAPGGWQLIRATPCKLAEAPQYNQVAAEAIAGQLANGNNERGRAVHIRQALTDAIASTEAIIKSLQLFQACD